MSNENEVAKVVKPSDMESKRQNKHNVDRVMPNVKRRIKHYKTI